MNLRPSATVVVSNVEPEGVVDPALDGDRQVPHAGPEPWDGVKQSSVTTLVGTDDHFSSVDLGSHGTALALKLIELAPDTSPELGGELWIAFVIPLGQLVHQTLLGLREPGLLLAQGTDVDPGRSWGGFRFRELGGQQLGAIGAEDALLEEGVDGFE
ncbi:hypothetical protein [Streptomyces sp. AJS327]|uniref:hypothetical protein n=1 Tax=Streptomyces sp. AJS327 TaxID=2545265 RepID=UPI002155A023|nr:hypothetical protein [Streptomyces sp. AJS327]